MSLHQSEKNFLERLADHVPGLAGYRARESRRDTDKRLRDHLAGRIDRGREALQRVRRERTGAGDLTALGEVGEVDRRLQRAADALRHATYGYGGLFDQVKMRDEELERIYRFDLRLLDRVEALERALTGAGGPADLPAASAQADELLGDIRDRGEIFETPAGGQGR